jgi:arabinose-5-phosphate isomerase
MKNKHYLENEIKFYLDKFLQSFICYELKLDEVSELTDFISNSKGKICITGVGKSSIVANKWATSFASIGLESFYINVTDLLHGSIGMINRDIDRVIIVSKTGISREIVELFLLLSNRGYTVALVTQNNDLNLEYSKNAKVIKFNRIDELDKNNLIPSNSFMLFVLIGDIMTSLIINKKEFDQSSLVSFHPSGQVGRLSLNSIESFVIGLSKISTVTKSETILNALLSMSDTEVGATFIVDKNKKLIGIMTDGDMRRTISNVTNALNEKIGNYMTINPVAVSNNSSVIEVVEIFRNNNFNVLAVTKGGTLVGAIKASMFLESPT